MIKVISKISRSFSLAAVMAVMGSMVFAPQLAFAGSVSHSGGTSGKTECEPVDAVLLIDASGTMSEGTVNDGSKLEVAGKAGKAFAEALSDQDRVGVVSYQAEPSIDIRLTNNIGDVKSAIEALEPGSMTKPTTNIGDGFVKAIEVLSDSRMGAKSVIIHLSDGIANQPFASDAKSRDYAIEKAREAQANGAVVYSIALGKNVDKDLMRKTATSDDTYYYAPNSGDLMNIYQEILEAECKRNPGTVSGVKYYDENGNGTRDNDEGTLSGVTIQLDSTDSDRPTRETATDKDGKFTFENVVLGQYRVTEVVPGTYTQTQPKKGYYAIDVSEGERVEDIKFGNDEKDVCNEAPEKDLVVKVFDPVNGKALVKNTSENCSYHVGVAAYKGFGNDDGSLNISTQELFAAATTTVEAGETVHLYIDVPMCAYQFDLFRGELIRDLSTGDRYGDRKIGSGLDIYGPENGAALINTNNLCKNDTDEPEDGNDDDNGDDNSGGGGGPILEPVDDDDDDGEVLGETKTDYDDVLDQASETLDQIAERIDEMQEDNGYDSPYPDMPHTGGGGALLDTIAYIMGSILLFAVGGFYLYRRLKTRA